VAWTQTDVDKLKAAIASGVKSVVYADRTVSYHSLDEMLKALAVMEAEVAGAAASGGSTTYASFARE
jgi:hypothetical protein